MWWSAVLSLVVLGEEVQGSGKAGFGKRKALGRGLSSYQMFKAALDFLGKCVCWLLLLGVGTLILGLCSEV